MCSLPAPEKLLHQRIARQPLLKITARLCALHGIRAMLVGGAVRDLLLGKESFDLDIVVEYHTATLAQALRNELSASLVMHPRFGTAALSIGTDEHLDLATARTETYAVPGQLPTVTFATIEQDLARRDFTVNAMAAPLTGEGEILDPFNGMRDLSSRTLRLLHAASFQDDPTRLMRMARFASRGFVPDAEAVALACRDAGAIRSISIERVREELLAILREEKPSAALYLLQQWGVWSAIFPDIPLTTLDGIDAAPSLAARLAALVTPCADQSSAVLARLKLPRALKREIR